MNTTAAEKPIPTVIRLTPLLRSVVERYARENERSLSAEVRHRLLAAYEREMEATVIASPSPPGETVGDA